MERYRVMYCPRGDWRYPGNACDVVMVNECPVCQTRLTFVQTDQPAETGADAEAAYEKFLAARTARNREEALAADPPESLKEPEHLTSEDCWCEPELVYVDPDNGSKVWCHRQVQ